MFFISWIKISHFGGKHVFPQLQKALYAFVRAPLTGHPLRVVIGSVGGIQTLACQLAPKNRAIPTLCAKHGSAFGLPIIAANCCRSKSSILSHCKFELFLCSIHLIKNDLAASNLDWLWFASSWAIVGAGWGILGSWQGWSVRATLLCWRLRFLRLFFDKTLLWSLCRGKSSPTWLARALVVTLSQSAALAYLS